MVGRRRLEVLHARLWRFFKAPGEAAGLPLFQGVELRILLDGGGVSEGIRGRDPEAEAGGGVRGPRPSERPIHASGGLWRRGRGALSGPLCAVEKPTLDVGGFTGRQPVY